MAVEMMLQYLYRLDYTCATEAHSDYLYDFGQGPILTVDDNDARRLSSLQLLANAHMYNVGDKYGIDGLKGIASEKFATILNQPEWHAKWDSSTMGIGALVTVIKYIFDSTPESDRGLRDQILGYAVRHLKSLLALEDFKVVLAKVPEFSYQLLVQEVEDRFLETEAWKQEIMAARGVRALQVGH